MAQYLFLFSSCRRLRNNYPTEDQLFKVDFTNVKVSTNEVLVNLVNARKETLQLILTWSEKKARVIIRDNSTRFILPAGFSLEKEPEKDG